MCLSKFVSTKWLSRPLQPQPTLPANTNHDKPQIGEQPGQQHRCCQGHLNPEPAPEPIPHYPFGFSKGLGYTTESWHPSSPVTIN